MVLRYSTGADIFGSNVSTCVGPPPSQSQTTEVFLVGWPRDFSSARAFRRFGRANAESPSDPILTKSLRLRPLHNGPRRGAVTWSIEDPCSSAVGRRAIHA